MVMNAATLERVNKAKASKTHGMRGENGPDKDVYGCTVATGGKVVVVPEPIVRRDGTYTSRRMRDLADMVGEFGGFVVALQESADVKSGYAVSVHPEREDRRRGFVTGAYLADFILNNLDLLSHPAAVLRVHRVGKTGPTYLNVCTVVTKLDTAKVSAHMHEREKVVRMADGMLMRV